MNSDAKTFEDYIAKCPDWQAKNLQLFHDSALKVAPDLTIAIKWGVPVYMLDKKMVFASAVFKAHTKFNFIANGALIADPHKLFNNGFDSKKSRAIDLKEGETIDTKQLAALIKAAYEAL